MQQLQWHFLTEDFITFALSVVLKSVFGVFTSISSRLTIEGWGSEYTLLQIFPILLCLKELSKIKGFLFGFSPLFKTTLSKSSDLLSLDRFSEFESCMN